MTDDIEVSLRSIEGEGPSREFVAKLRARIDQEPTKPVATVNDEIVVEIDIRPGTEERTMSTKQWLLGAAAAAITLIVGLVAFSGGTEDGGVESIDAPTTTVVTTTVVTTTPPEPVSFAADATRLTQEYSRVAEGTHRVDTLGTSLSFTLDGAQFVQPNSQGFFVLSDPSSRGPDDREIVFMRLSALWDPADPNALIRTAGDGWPVDDFAGWIDSLADGVITSNQAEVTLGGLDATRVDIEFGEIECSQDPEYCIGFGTNRLVQNKMLNAGAQYRIWIVGQGDESPLAVIVGIADESNSEWFDTADDILSTLAFGDVAPNPISGVPAGPAELPLLGGISVSVAEEMTVVEVMQNFGRIPLDGQPADIEFLTNPLDPEGNSIASPDELVALLGERDIEVTELESTTIGGIEARVFEIAGEGGPNPVLKRDPEDADGWRPPRMGQLWLVDHPTRGLLMINAEAWADVHIHFPLVVDKTEAILGSLEFVELD